MQQRPEDSSGDYAYDLAHEQTGDRDAAKEVWLLFANDHGQFPLYPGESTWIEYSYTVSDDKWGPWFQRLYLPCAQALVPLRSQPEQPRFRLRGQGKRCATAVSAPRAVQRCPASCGRVTNWAP